MTNLNLKMIYWTPTNVILNKLWVFRNTTSVIRTFHLSEHPSVPTCSDNWLPTLCVCGVCGAFCFDMLRGHLGMHGNVWNEKLSPKHLNRLFSSINNVEDEERWIRILNTTLLRTVLVIGGFGGRFLCTILSIIFSCQQLFMTLVG